MENSFPEMTDKKDACTVLMRIGWMDRIPMSPRYGKQISQYWCKSNVLYIATTIELLMTQKICSVNLLRA